MGRGGLGEAASDAGLLPGAGGGSLGEEEEGGQHLLLGAGRREDAVAATREDDVQAAAVHTVSLWQQEARVLLCRLGCMRARPLLHASAQASGARPTVQFSALAHTCGSTQPNVLPAVPGFACCAIKNPALQSRLSLSAAEIVRRPGDAENALRLLHHQLRLLRVPEAAAGKLWNWQLITGMSSRSLLPTFCLRQPPQLC